MNAPALTSIEQEGGGADRRAATVSGAFGHVPGHQRHRMFAGMRWSFWLSGLAAGVGAAINFLLAQCGPETLAVYGLLSVYVGLLTSLFYFGGDAVVIKFTPECDASERPSFLVSYMVVILLFLVPFIGIGSLWPSLIRDVLGHDLDDRTTLLFLCVAPLPIAYQVTVAGLKGMLEIKTAQILSKSVTIVSLLAYVVVIVVKPSALTTHPRATIWGLYLACAAIAAVAGVAHIYRVSSHTRLRFFLPRGFWRYALDTQAVSVSTFLSSRLDYVCLLNFGTLEMLGRYAAVVAAATTVGLISTLFMDTMLPLLANMVAARNEAAAAQVCSLHMRILFVVTVGTSCAIIVMAPYICRIIGKEYGALATLMIVAAMFQGISIPGTYGGTLLSSVGQQRPAVVASLFKAILFVGVFLTGRHASPLAAAVVANGLAGIGSALALMVFARKRADFYPSFSALWLKAACIEASAAAAALYWAPLDLAQAGLVWALALVLLLFAGRYTPEELKDLLRIFLGKTEGIRVPALSQ